MFGAWELVRPHVWHPMASFEQSMMDLDALTEAVMQEQQQQQQQQEEGEEGEGHMLHPLSVDEEEEFFRDLPMRQRKPTVATTARAVAQEKSQEEQEEREEEEEEEEEEEDDEEDLYEEEEDDMEKEEPPAPSKDQDQVMMEAEEEEEDQQPPPPAQPSRTFTSYSFSSSSVLDEKGRRCVSTRRRYEDSTGRLKAIHEREIAGKKMKTVWNKRHPQDDGLHEMVCIGSTPEVFEQEWMLTPFGKAHEKVLLTEKQSEQQQEPHHEP